MKPNPKVSCAIAAILSGCGIGMGTAHAAAADAPDAAAGESEGIQEVTVTAQRRVESVQDVPITIQALTSATLEQLNVTTFDDVIRYLPNVTFGSNGPGTGNIFMRGLSAGFSNNQSSATIGQFPNVATYLDEQSMTFPSRNLDIYVVDMERLEVLEGPQGTLFGGGAEAGAVRYITNKPKLNVTEGNVEASYGVTAHGDPNSSGNATLNLPLVADHVAVRVAIYSDHRGGYIDNVQSNFTRKNSDLGNYYSGIKPGANGLCPNGLPTNTGYCAVPGSPIANNNDLVQRAENPLTYTGIRASALFQINEDWNVLVAQSYQNMDAEGEFAQYPIGSDGQALGAWQITQFTPAWDKDSWENTAWTVNGKIGDLRLIYTGGYLDRHIDQQQDYTNYARSADGWYYSCTGGTGLGARTVSNATPTCYSPVTWWRDQVQNTHQSHELRLSTPDDWRVRGILGGYWEDFVIHDNMNFDYKTVPSCTPANLSAALAGGLPCVADVSTFPGSTAVEPGERGDNVAFGEDAQRGYHQTAVFGSVDYDIIPKVLTITGGTRWYRYTESETGSVYATGTSCVNLPNGDCYDVNINHENLAATYTGFRSRGNITWHITPDTMVYYTFSQGFRPGAFNRSQRDKADILDTATGTVVPQYKTPQGYAPDSLTNNEIGLKSEFFDHRLLVDLSAYHMNWDNVQLLFYNPVSLGNTTFGVTGPNYTVNGAELQLTARVTEGLTILGSGSWNRARQANSPCLVSNEPGSPTLGQCITQVYAAATKTNVAFQNPYGAVGTVPPFSPASELNVRARYDWVFNDYKSYVMVGANHIGAMFNEPATYQSGDSPSEVIPTTTFLRYEMPGYTTYDATLGVSKDNWWAAVFGENLSNSNASTLTSSGQFIKQEFPLRPRVLGLKIGYKF